MSVVKTKELLVDVARQLFAKNGFENTSMNDIAVAANRGRRTLYTYLRARKRYTLLSYRLNLNGCHTAWKRWHARIFHPRRKLCSSSLLTWR